MADVAGRLSESIAIIGMACRFPGGANNVADFWNLLLNEVDAIRESPDDRWKMNLYPLAGEEPANLYLRRGGFLDRVDWFDAEFFGISPREASRVDPQHRLLLELAWEALEDAGQVPERLAGTKTGVFIGISSDEFGELQFKDVRSMNAYTNIGGALSIAANRISYFFDFHGPSLSVDTACSSSLVALHLACQSIWNRESELALVGGVNLILSPERTIGFSRASMLSPDGLCRSFEARANGYVRSEGAGVVMLKPLSQARADRDPIYADILATGVNQDGRTIGLSLPNGAAQEALLRAVYSKAGIAPERVQYVEAHGTGTPVGDPIECSALGRALGVGRLEGNPLLIGSVKSNIGHLEAAAGIAGLIKLALSLKHRQIPASLHVETPNPKIAFEELHLQIQRKTGPWPNGQEAAIGGVTSFGFGGTNAHAILRSNPDRAYEPEKHSESQKAHLLPISARSSKALESFALAYRALLFDQPDLSLRDLCYSASVRRTHHDYRLALVANSNSQLMEKLESFLAGERRLGSFVGRKQGEGNPKVAFAFSGNGPQWWAMGRQLLEKEPTFRNAIHTCDQLLGQYTSWSLLQELAADEASSRMDKTEIAQPALFALQAGLLALWRSWGIKPDAVLGHSVGEITAAYAAGILSLEDAIKVIFHRSRTQETTAGQGKMAVVELEREEATRAIAGYAERLSIAAINAPKSVTLSGDADALENLVRSLEEEGIFCRYLGLNYAFHSHHMEPIREDLLNSLAGLRPRASDVHFISTVIGTEMKGTECGPEYWWDNIRKPVLFSQAVDYLIRNGYSLFLEIGPHPVLANYIAECASKHGRPSTILPSLKRKEDEFTTLLGSLGFLYANAFPVDWDKLYPEGGRLVPLPTYPWQRERHWNEAEVRPLLHGRRVHPLLGQRVESANPQWQVEIDKRDLTYLDDHRIQGAVVYPAAAYIEMGLAAAAQLFGQGPTEFDLEIREALVLTGSHPPIVQTIASPDLRFTIYSQGTGGDQEWRAHVTGQLSRSRPPNRKRALSIGEIRSRLPYELSKEEHYRRCGWRNHQYLATFQGVERIWWNETEALGHIRVPASLASESLEYSFHPAVLDACLQVISTVLQNRGGSARSAFFPISIEQFRFYARPGNELYSYVRRIKSGSNWLSADLSITDLDGRLIAEIQGLRVRAIELVHAGSDSTVDDLLYEFRWQLQPLPGAEFSKVTTDNLSSPGQLERSGRWILYTDTRGLGQDLRERLVSSGQEVILVEHGQVYQRISTDRFMIRPRQAEDMDQLVQTLQAQRPFTGIVHCWGLDTIPPEEITIDELAAAQELGCLSVIHLIQAINKAGWQTNPRLWLVTNGAQSSNSRATPISIAQSPLWGLGRVVLAEHPEFRCTLVDLNTRIADADPASFSRDEIRGLYNELVHSDHEQEILLQGPLRFVNRLLRAPLDGTVPIRERHALQEFESFRLELPQPAVVENLILRSVPRSIPRPGEVEIEVYAAGLNFKDVLQATGLLSGEALEHGFVGGVSLGLECAGKVVRIGEGVENLQIGDQVVAFGRHCFSGHVTTPADLVIHKPSHLSFEEAVTIPVTFLTAYYALHHLGRLKKGERVLIHGATGGVGLAAIQIVRQAGGEVFATAGSPEKREFLRSLGVAHVMDSRKLTFADEIMETTNRDGVDIVLNSLTGEAVTKSLRVLRPFGRFLEIGKRDFLENSQVGMRPFEKCLSFYAIDIDQLLLHDRGLARYLFNELIEYFNKRVFQPLRNRVFPLAQVKNAFREMQQSRHIGKIVISLRDPDISIQLREQEFKFRNNGTYLITGGVSGFGLAAAQWMVERGSRHLVLLGRSGAVSGEAQAAIVALREAGAEVQVAKVDVTQESEVASLFSAMRESLPPLRGIMHAANEMDDGILLYLDQARLKKVMGPKMIGAWNLHTHSLGLPLDFFVLFSSFTSMFGNAGQANYVAGNAFLDALAHYRRALGLPALALNWGALAEVGYVARHADVGARLARLGIKALPPATALAALERLLITDRVQVGVADLDWQQLRSAAGGVPNGLFKSIQIESEPHQGDKQSDDFGALLGAASPAQQKQVVEARLCLHVASVLGTSASKLDREKPLPLLGLDSLMAVELHSLIENDMGVDISVMNLTQRQTIADLASFIVESLAQSRESVTEAR